MLLCTCASLLAHAHQRIMKVDDAMVVSCSLWFDQYPCPWPRGSVPEAGVRDPPAGILQPASVQRRVGLDEVVDGWLTKSLCLRQGMLAVVCSRQEPRAVAVSCDSSKETSDTRTMDSAATHSCAPARMLVLEFESTSRGKAAISDTCWIIFTRFPLQIHFPKSVRQPHPREFAPHEDGMGNSVKRPCHLHFAIANAVRVRSKSGYLAATAYPTPILLTTITRLPHPSFAVSTQKHLSPAPQHWG